MGPIELAFDITADLRAEVITMLLAGHETTANALTWTFALLGRHAIRIEPANHHHRQSNAG